MAWSVTLNGTTYTNADFDGQAYVDTWPNFWADMAAVAAGIAAAAGAGGTFLGSLTIASADPLLVMEGSGTIFVRFNATGGGADQKFAELVRTPTGTFYARFVNDAYSFGSSWLEVYQNSGTYTTQFVCFPSGIVGIGNAGPTISGAGKLHMTADTFRLDTARTPASAGAAGNAGEFCWDASYVYVCTAANTWRRIAHASW